MYRGSYLFCPLHGGAVGGTRFWHVPVLPTPLLLPFVLVFA
jgi:hypothetical protein